MVIDVNGIDFRHERQFFTEGEWEAFKSTLDMSDSRFRILVEECEALREREAYYYLRCIDSAIECGRVDP